MKLNKRTINVLEKAGFSYHQDEYNKKHCFEKYSPAMQEFSFTLNDEDDIIDLAR